MNEKLCILFKISLQFVPRDPIDSNPALAYIMAWRQIGNKPLSEPMLPWFTDAYTQHWGRWVKPVQGKDCAKIFLITNRFHDDFAELI